jgi:hypothetical protein
VVFSQVSSPCPRPDCFCFVLLISTGVRYCAHPTSSKACPGILPIQSILPQERKSRMEDMTATIRQARWIAGRRRARFRRWISWLPVVHVFLNASLGEVSALSSTRFLGGVLDTRAAIPCVGYRQARALCNLTGVPYDSSTGTRRFTFGDVVSEPYGILTVPLRTPVGIATFPIRVMPQNVPLLIGAEILYSQQWYIRNVTDELVSTASWTLPIARFQGHYWIRHGFDELPASTLFTRTQLYHLHRHF